MHWNEIYIISQANLQKYPFIMFLIKLELWFLFQGFRYLELQNNYKCILNSVVSSFID